MYDISYMKTRFCTESETTSDYVIRDCEAGRWGGRWHRVTLDDFLALKGL